MSESLEQRRQELRQQIARLRLRIDRQLRSTPQRSVIAAARQPGILSWAGRFLLGLGWSWLAGKRTRIQPTLRRLWRFVRRSLRNAKPETPRESAA